MNSLPTPTAALRRLLLACALGGAFPLAASAQTALAPTPAQLAKYDTNKNGVLDAAELAAMQSAETKPSNAVLLTPFNVSTDKDRGYAAGNTLSGGRVDTPLALSSASISVMTKEFLQDFDITDMNQAAAWTLNMDAPTGGESGPFGGNRFESNFRGAGGGGNYPMRDGFVQFFVADSYNSERFDFSRGPNALMFGSGGPGGLQGSGSKQVRFNNRSGSVGTRVDSYGSYRGSIDYNQGFDRFGVRFNALHQNSKSFQDDTDVKQNAVTLAASFKISANTQLRAQYEKSSEWGIQYRKTWADQATFWNRTTVNENNTAITNPGLSGLGFLAGNATTDRLTYNFGTNSILNYRGFQYQTVGLGYQIPWEGRRDLQTNFHPGFSKSFRMGPIDNIADRDNNTMTIMLDHRFSQNLYVQLNYLQSDVDPVTLYAQGLPGDYRIDVNKLLPTGASNPSYGKAYSEFGQNSQYQQNFNRTFQLTTNYSFEAPKLFGMKQRFNLNGGRSKGKYEAWNRAWRWTNNPAQLNPTNNANTVNFRIYYDNPRPAIAPILNADAMARLNPGMTFRNVDTGFGADNRSQNIYGQIVSQTTFFNDRLSLTFGARRDRNKGGNLANIGFDTAANNYALLMGGFNPATGVNERDFRSTITNFRTSKNGGLVVYPFPSRFRFLAPLGFIANYSQNFTNPPTGTTLYTGERPSPPFSETKDFGLRYSVPNGVLYATLTHYDTDQVGQLGNFGSQQDIRNIWLNLGYTDPKFTEFGPFRDLSDRKLEGWEFEVTANPTRNLTFTANYSHPTVTTNAESVGRREYVAKYLAEWQAGAAATAGQVIGGRTILDPVVIRDSVLNIENSFNGSTAGTIQNGARHRINLSGRYGFTEGKLRGLAVNGGINYRSHNKTGSRDARLKYQTTTPTLQQTTEAAWDYLWTQPTWTTSAGVNYTRRFGKYSARFQINVTNLLNDSDPQWNGYSVIQAGQFTGQGTNNAFTVAGSNPRMQVLSGFNQPDPRKFVFTTTLDF